MAAALASKRASPSATALAAHYRSCAERERIAICSRTAACRVRPDAGRDPWTCRDAARAHRARLGHANSRLRSAWRFRHWLLGPSGDDVRTGQACSAVAFGNRRARLRFRRPAGRRCGGGPSGWTEARRAAASRTSADFLENWRVLLVSDILREGLHGPEERRGLAALAPFPQRPRRASVPPRAGR